jgi:hypothetical protein
VIEHAIAGAANGASQNPSNHGRGMVTAVTGSNPTLVTVGGRKMVALAPVPAVGDWVIYSRNPPFVLGTIAG